jgi:GntR family transcriptional regulator, transcriptional repressor for pyruvate dehydrogenase complex
MSVTDDAILEIKRLITSGQVGPGEKLPKESRLAAQLGLSRSSLREAVRALTLIGVLDARQGDGTYVTGLGPQLLLEATAFVVDFLLDPPALLELLEVRRLLEPTATALAAVRIDERDLLRLHECNRRMESASSVEELVEADDEFHSIIVDAAGQATLASLIKSLAGRTFRARIWRGLVDERALEQTKRAHAAIYRAIECRDAELARAAATMHITEVEFWFRSRFDLR